MKKVKQEKIKIIGKHGQHAKKELQGKVKVDPRLTIPVIFDEIIRMYRIKGQLDKSDVMRIESLLEITLPIEVLK